MADSCDDRSGLGSRPIVSWLFCVDATDLLVSRPEADLLLIETFASESHKTHLFDLRAAGAPAIVNFA